jgi:N-acyl-D-amino-acid deacylase
MFDITIRGGRIMDGSSTPWFRGDVGISGDRIAAVGDLSAAEARTNIDATDKVVCPGFVDCHSHSDLTILANREASSSIFQGVTTEIVGNCGLGFAPITDKSRKGMEKYIQGFCSDVPVDWFTFGEYLNRIENGIAINIGLLVGHGVVRRAVMGTEHRTPARDEMEAMERLAAESLDAGALGLSFGLEYLPGRVADAEELRRLCAVAARRNKVTAWHVRNRDRKFVEAVDEAISVTQETGAALQLSHLSAKPGSSARAWNRVMETVRLARAEGHDVQCDMIPYTVGPGLLSTILPDWVSRGSTEQVQARLRDPVVRAQLVAESDRYWLLFYYREWDKLTLTASRSHPDWIGMTFREIGEAAGKDPFDCVYDILADEGETMDQVWINGVLFSEGDVAEWISDPLFCIGSDGWTTKNDGPLAEVTNHPSCYGWTPRVIQKYVREMRTMRLEEAIRKMTSMPATRFGLTDRGMLRANMVADVIVFDEDDFQTRATYFKPHVYAEGMAYVIVNGRIALREGTPTGVLSGCALSK